MHYVGVDLAWGERAPTGIAVLDPDARLVHVSAQRSDEEVVAAIEGVVAGGTCLVAIDAPLIVRNPTGNRGCEAALNKDFARFDAGAHPANTGKPEFAETPRGARVAGLLGLDLNPRSGRQRRAIEVYPHPATVSLFRLGRTLKYKNKPGRDLESLRSELLALMGYLETVVVTAGEPWLRLRDAVEGTVGTSAPGALQVNVAVGYGGRQEIVDAVRGLLSKELANGATAEQLIESVTVDAISENLYTSGQPDPDLVMIKSRHGGERAVGEDEGLHRRETAAEQ